MKSKLSQYISEKFSLYALFCSCYLPLFILLSAPKMLYGSCGAYIFTEQLRYSISFCFSSHGFSIGSGLFLRSAGFGYVWRGACSVFCFTLSSSFWSAMLPQWRSSFFIRIRWRSQFPGVSPLESAWVLWPTEWFTHGVSKQFVMTCAWEKAKKITA